MDILSNELVRKYFNAFGKGEMMAQRVLSAMQDPIRKGDSLLSFHQDTRQFIETIAASEWDGFHPLNLRLPDRFQKKECFTSIQQQCPECGRLHVWNPDLSAKPAPEPLIEPKRCVVCKELFGAEHPLAQNCTKPKPEPEKKYPCIRCGKDQGKDGGGTIFTTCEECWDKPEKCRRHNPGPLDEPELEKCSCHPNGEHEVGNRGLCWCEKADCLGSHPKCSHGCVESACVVCNPREWQ